MTSHPAAERRDDFRDSTRRGDRPPTADVERALASLADGSAPASPAHRRPIENACVAVADVESAAAFVSGGGLADLRRAVADARRRGDDAARRLGRTVLETLARFRAAAADPSDTCQRPPERREDTRDSDRPENSGEGRGRAGSGVVPQGVTAREATPEEYFHRAHGTILPGGGQSRDR